MKWLLWLVVIIVVLGGAGLLVAWQVGTRRSTAPVYRTATVKRGDIAVTIAATGTVEPEEVIDMGAQITGRINSFGTDSNGKPIDYCSPVEAGMVLARIDDIMYKADYDNAKATVDLAKAGVLRAQADLKQLQAKLDQAERDWKRAQKIGPSDALAETAYDAYRAAYEVATANVEVGKAAIVQAQNQISQAEAQLNRAQQNLSYCTIVSPVKGVIIDRRVNIGQTVVANLNAASLFLLAKDLKRIQVWVAMNEADIGSIQLGQPVTITVDAFPDEVFHGTVGKVRLNATMTQNVVTYPIVVETDNSSGRLLPYLTANAQFEVARHTGVLQVANAALRWTPSVAKIVPEFRQGMPKSGGEPESGAPAETQAAGTQAAKSPSGRGILWVQDGEFLRPVPVRTGLSDGAMTEVSGRDVQDGMTIVTGEKTADAEEAGVTNPFTPQFGQAFRQKPSTKDKGAASQGKSGGPPPHP